MILRPAPQNPESLIDCKRPSFLPGTSCYKPPEFSIRGTYEAGPTTVWQLGAILYEMLCQDVCFRRCDFYLYESLLRKMVMKLNVTKGSNTSDFQ